MDTSRVSLIFVWMVFECFCFWQRHHITVNLWSACGAAGSSSCTRDLASCSSSCLSLRPNWASATVEVTYLEPEAPSTASTMSSVIVKILGARGRLAFCNCGAPFQKGSLSSPNCLLFEFRNLCLQVFCGFLGQMALASESFFLRVLPTVLQQQQ